MIETIYIEENLADHPRVQEIVARFPEARRIPCGRYGEVFNPKAQNFRLQKRRPALILAEKFRNFALPAPAGYGIGAHRNYYFSHMLNCLYDCRYCFLQGMYPSAHYVLFVNYEDFQQDIRRIAEAHPDEAVHFFSGYDCDSLALEPVTGFAAHFLPFFSEIPNAWLELRTKSAQIRPLLAQAPLPRCIVAFSLNPEQISEKLEHKAPSLQKRLDAVRKLQEQGWPVGLRFDPLIFQPDYQDRYRQFFGQVFAHVDPKRLHSVSLGAFRLPEQYFKKAQKLYPDEKLFAGPMQLKEGMIGYEGPLEKDMLAYCVDLLSHYIASERFFPCAA
ncbi:MULTISPECIES: SPL family radical SAM protein [Methylomicrobium]|uniref:DNA repair photolyase n=1 Tax=Methylomicrobium album BG8 TaxID=686340 RepID=H8GIT5_METAL|nr:MULTISPECIES: hypothetical protein [Methylomicrobium]EIC30275.1 DNA repair photolyase [Methylomicrobium album BG8]